MISGELTTGAALKIEASKRLSPYERQSFAPESVEVAAADGWVFDRKMKSSTRMRRLKAHDVAFEDRVWAMFARLGFDSLNKGRTFRLSWSERPNATKQIDVFAMDGESILVVECKSSAAKVPPSATFKDEADIIRGYKSDLLPRLGVHFPGRKIRFVLITNNFAVSEESIERIEDMQISYLDERNVDYYLALADHLGPASKYQFLAAIFRGTRIAGLEGEVPALRGKMGGTEYFTFMIEPARLLKLAHVLHRNSTAGTSMQAYQRIIKKPRLKRVQAFVEGGGYFPNSLVINIDSGGRPLKFDQASIRNGASRLGVLHLPQSYGSAYIIDGQHRLYGFAGSSRADNQLVPVVAFVDMKPEEQVRLFMQINENQQAVPKNLRNTLNGDLLWHSSSLLDQAKALRLRVSQHLGEEKTSPLIGRVVLGEDKLTRTRCISIDALSRGIDRGGFVGEFTVSDMRQAGTFYRGSIDRTIRPLTVFMELLFAHLARQMPVQWNLGRGEGGFVFINNGIEALLRLAGDLVRHIENDGVNPRSQAPREVMDAIRPHLDSVIRFLNSASRETAAELRGSYGSAGATKYWRRLQLEVTEFDSSFQPPGLREWAESLSHRILDESVERLEEFEARARDLLQDSLQSTLGADWWREGLPSGVYERAHAARARGVFAGEVDDEASWWSFVGLEDLASIATHGSGTARLDSALASLPRLKANASSGHPSASWFAEAVDIAGRVRSGTTLSLNDQEVLSRLVEEVTDLAGRPREGASAEVDS